MKANDSAFCDDWLRQTVPHKCSNPSRREKDISHTYIHRTKKKHFKSLHSATHSLAWIFCSVSPNAYSTRYCLLLTFSISFLLAYLASTAGL